MLVWQIDKSQILHDICEFVIFVSCFLATIPTREEDASFTTRENNLW